MLKKLPHVEEAYSVAGHFLERASLVAGCAGFLDLIFTPFETTFLELLADVFGVQFGDYSPFVVELTLVAFLGMLWLLLFLAGRQAHRREGIAQLADACCIHTVRLVTLLRELRERPERASNALDSDGLYGIPLESALFRFRIANISLLEDRATWNPLNQEDVDASNCVSRSRDKLVASDVEYDFKFKLARYAKFFDKLPLVSWIFGDNGKVPQEFRYYYAHRSIENDRIASPEPYKKSSFSYSPNEGLYVVCHDVCPASAGPDRVFGMHYFKRGCLGWDYDDDFTIYPTAIAGKVRKATFRVELQKEISDVLDSFGGVRLEIHEFVCSGKKPGNGHQPAHFIRKDIVTAGVQRDRKNDGAAENSESLFCDGREYVVFETPEVPVDSENVYIVLVKAQKEALDVLRLTYDPDNPASRRKKSKLKQVVNCVFAKDK